MPKIDTADVLYDAATTILTTTRPSILCVTQKTAFMPLYIVLGQQRACMPVYIGKSGDLVTPMPH